MRKIPLIEVYLSGNSIWWAIVLFLSPELLVNVPKLLSPFTRLGQDVWATIFLIAAFLKIIGILTEKTLIRKVGLWFSFFLYGLICSGFILSGHLLSQGTGMYFMMSVFALIGIRLVGDDYVR